MNAKRALCVMCIALTAAPVLAQVEPVWRPRVLVVDSFDQPVREIPTGMKVQLPIVVSDIPSLAGRGLHFEADLEFLGPQGQVLWSRKSCCRKIVRDTPQGHRVALEPLASVQFEPNDTAGLYTVRAVVNDGQRTATATETLSFGTGKSESGGMRLQMDVPKKNPGVDRDVRDCLALPTPQEVIKCTERGKK